MLLPGFGCLLSLQLALPLLLVLLLLLQLPRAVQSSNALTVASHLLDFAQLPDALLMSCVQQLIQTPIDTVQHF